MSWINSNATYKQNSKNDLSFYHGFSKTPVEPSSTGTAVTSLGNASTKGGHTVIGTEVWAEEIPWFGLVPSRAVAVTRLSGLTKLNDLVKVDESTGAKVYKYIGADDATFTEDTWSNFWQEITLTNGMELQNRHGDSVLRYYLNQPMQTLTVTNNASIDSKGYATRLFVNESDHTGQTSGGAVVSQFAAGTDNIKNGIPSVELNPKLYLGTTEQIAGTNYYDYNVSGTILWNKAVTSSSPKISCFRYIGKTVTGQFATVESTISTHAKDISDIKLALGLEDTPVDPNASSVTERVETVEDVVRVLLGLGSDATITATESVATTAANAVSTSLEGTTDGTIGKAIADAKGEVMNAINAIQHFNVKVVDALPESAAELVENTIYLVPEKDKTSGNYVEYIAYKPEGSETVTTERIGTTAVDLEGYTTDEEFATLASQEEGKEGRVTVLEGKVTTLTGDETVAGSVAKALADAKDYTDTAIATELAEGGSIAKAIADAKEQAIASAEVTITAGTGIVVTGEGKGTTFEIAVSDDVATAASVSALTQVVAFNKTELEDKITAASTALNDAKTEIKGTTDALDGRLTTAEGKVTTLEGQVATLTGDETVAGSVDSKIQAAIESITKTTDDIYEAVNGVKDTADTAVQTASGDTYVSAEKETDSTNIKVTTNIDAIASAVDAALVKDGTAVATAIAGAATAGTDAADALADTAITEQSVSGSGISVTLGGKVGVPTLTGSVTTASYADGAWTDGEKVATGSTVAAAIKDVDDKINTLHSTAVTYKVYETKPEASEELKGIIALVPAGEGDSAVAGSYIEWLCVESVAEDGSKSYSWEQIGTTAANFSQYAKTADLKVEETTANGLTYSQTNGLISVSVNAATTGQVGTVKLTDAYNNEEDDKAATCKAIADAIGTLASTKSVNGITVTQENGVVSSITEELITASVPADTTSVKGNVAYVGSTKHVIAPDKFQTAAQMPATLTSWVADLSNLTNGDNMFNGCTGLTVFVGDLSSLTSAVDMFNGCTLDSESLEILAENLPTVSGGTIDIGASTNATDEVIATIKGKGWTVKSNGTDL